jgi:glycosyltransferase involved in cell wall biosynthesis
MERYADELAAALGRLGCDAQPYVLPRPWPGLGGRAGGLANHVWRTLAYPAAAGRRQGQVNHILDHSYAHLLRHLEPGRTVVSCHDLAPLFDKRTGAGLSRWHWQRSFGAMQTAGWILTSSEFTRRELLAHTRFPAERITVAGYGVSEAFCVPAPAAEVNALREGIGAGSRPVILHVGSCQPRKNVEAVLQALPALRDLDPVFIQIGGSFTAAQSALTETASHQRQVMQMEAPLDRELALWYHAADVLAFPSWYEGFGLPVIEAMAAGTPVVCADAAALPEVAGGAAVMCDPRDPATLALAIRRVLTEAGLRQHLIAAGRARSQEFNWDRTARLAMRVYETLSATANPTG